MSEMMGRNRGGGIVHGKKGRECGIVGRKGREGRCSEEER